MKFILGVLAVIAVGFSVTTACSKKKTEPSDVTGKWREMLTSGGIGGGTIQFNNEMRVLQLNKDSSWSFNINDTLTLSGVYSLSMVASGDQLATQIAFTDNGSGYFHTQIVQLESGQMVLTDNNVSDGYTSVYTRWSP